MSGRTADVALPSGSAARATRVEKNAVQRPQRKRVGGCTGHGFVAGQSGNPGGRPGTAALSKALRTRVAEIGPDGRTVAQQIADVLVNEAPRGKYRIAAATLILEKLEGKATQRLDLNNVTQSLESRTGAELQYYLDHGLWPDPDAPLTENGEGRNEAVGGPKQ